jgi:pimeloyl-ACP methyl ester carboxylesterase
MLVGMAAIVFVHSAGASSRMWRPVSTLLADRYDVRAPDLPGHGDRPGPFTVDGAVGTVGEALPAGRSHLVGISAGATVAALTCLAAPDRVASLVLSGGIAHPPALLAVQRAVMAVLPTGLQAGIAGRVDPMLAEDFRRAGKPTVLAVLRALASVDLRPRLAEITVPALVAVGARDRANHPGARELAAGLPHAEHVVVPDAGHLWCLSTPERFADLVAAFVDRYPGAL